MKTIVLDENTAYDLAEDIRNLMCHWHVNPQGCDYVCEFCGESPSTNNTFDTKHRPNCSGEKYLKALENEDV